MLKVGTRSPTQPLLSLLDESPSHPRNTMPSSVASLIATPSDCLSTTLTRPMFLTFSHPSLSGNSLTRTGRTLPAPGGSFGRTTPSSLHSPPSVSATTTVITLQSWKTSRSTFKMSSLKSLTKIEISSSFTKLCLLQSIIATKLCWKFANHIDRLFQERPLPQFFQPIRAAQRGLPPVPESVTQRITTALELAYQVAQGKSPPVSDSNLKKDCGHRIPYIAMLTHWVPLTVSLASHLSDIFSTVVWLGLATCWRRTSERNLSVGSLRAFVLCFTRFHQVLGWSSCLALSNQQACVRPYCFTGRPRPIGTCFSTGSMVLSLWSAPSSFEIPALRVPRYRLAPVDCFFGSSVTGKAPC